MEQRILGIAQLVVNSLLIPGEETPWDPARSMDLFNLECFQTPCVVSLAPEIWAKLLAVADQQHHLVGKHQWTCWVQQGSITRRMLCPF